MSVFKQMRNQPEFHEQVWQYINRRVSDWRIINGKIALKNNEALFARIERDFGVERGTLLALWGVESAYGDPLVQQNHMTPVFPSLAALAWNEPRRKAYWETELINALQHRRQGLEHAGGNAAAPGPARWAIRSGCRRSGSMSASTMTATAGSHRSASPTTRWARRAKYLDQSRQVAAAASTGAMRCARPATMSGSRDLCGVASSRRHPRRRPAVPATERIGADVDAGCRRADLPARARISTR